MKKRVFYITGLYVFCCSLFAKPLEVTVSAKYAILMNPATEAVLFEKGAYKKHPPASTIKIITALYALKYGPSLDSEMQAEAPLLRKLRKEEKKKRGYQIDPSLLEPDGTHYALKPGEILTFRDLLYGLMLSSGNDAANVIAHHVSGNIPAFVEGLNTLAKIIGCKSTQIYNPHGLHYPGQWTTAYDMALLAREALKHPILVEIAKSTEYERPKTNKQTSKIVEQHNSLLMPGKFFYSKAVGMKTGYISDSGFNLVACAEHERRVLIAVLFGYEKKDKRNLDAITLFDAAFSEEKVSRLLFKKQENRFLHPIKGVKKPLQAVFHDDVFLEYFPSEDPQIKTELNWCQLNLPIKKREKVGEVLIKNEKGYLLHTALLYAEKSLYPSWKIRLLTIWKKTAPQGHYIRHLIGIGVLITLFQIIMFFRKRVRKQKG